MARRCGRSARMVAPTTDLSAASVSRVNVAARLRSVGDGVAAPAAAPDGELVALALDDRAAFASLYERYMGKVYMFCLDRLQEPAAAEDATSQVFLNALAALPRYRERGGGFRPWLFRIAHNVVVDAVRARRPLTDLAAAEE